MLYKINGNGLKLRRSIRRLMHRKGARRSWRQAIRLVGWIVVWLLSSTAVVEAHGGGIPRLTGEVAGPYRLFAWTQPEPLRVGEFHLSIGVIKGEGSDTSATDVLDEAITDATVVIHLTPVVGDTAPVTVPAVLQEQLGSYYYEADATLPTEGEWRFTIEVNGALGTGQAEFTSPVAAARQINWGLIGGAAFGLLCLLGLMGVWNRMQAKEMIGDPHKAL